MNNHTYNQNAPFQIFRLVCNLMEFLSASVNFLIYFLCNKQIRKEVTRLLQNGKDQITAKHSRPNNKHRQLPTKRQKLYDVIS